MQEMRWHFAGISLAFRWHFAGKMQYELAGIRSANTPLTH